MTRPKVTKAEVRNFQKLVKSGASFSEVARSTGRCRQTIQRFCTTNSAVERPLKAKIEKAVKKLRRRFPRKKIIGCKLIGSELGVSHQWVAKALKGLEISGRVLYAAWPSQNNAEDPEKVYSQGRLQGWC